MKEEIHKDQLYKDLEERFILWANERSDIRGVRRS